MISDISHASDHSISQCQLRLTTLFLSGRMHPGNPFLSRQLHLWIRQAGRAQPFCFITNHRHLQLTDNITVGIKMRPNLGRTIEDCTVSGRWQWLTKNRVVGCLRALYFPVVGHVRPLCFWVEGLPLWLASDKITVLWLVGRIRPLRIRVLGRVCPLRNRVVGRVRPRVIN